MHPTFAAYLNRIEADWRGGKATEYTYRSSLDALQPDIQASNAPKHVQRGAPDFIVERRHTLLGYVIPSWPLP